MLIAVFFLSVFLLLPFFFDVFSINPIHPVLAQPDSPPEGETTPPMNFPSTVWSEFPSIDSRYTLLGDGTRLWETTFGVYRFDKSKPYVMNFTDRRGVAQITRSMFWLNTSATLDPAKIVGATVSVAADRCFQVSYNATYKGGGLSKDTSVGRLVVTFNFFREQIPKISVLFERDTVAWGSGGLGDFNVVWVLLPVQKYLKVSEKVTIDFTAKTVMGKVKESSVKEEKRCEVGTGADPSAWTGGWSLTLWDDVEGTCVLYAGVEKVWGGKGITVVFPRNVILIDPSTVGTSTSYYATQNPFQRKGFYANGRFWAFWADGTNMVYATSTDGASWTGKATVRTCTNGHHFSIWFDGTYFHYAYAYDAAIYRRGTPNADSSITWSADEQTVSTTYNGACFPYVSVDSNGYVWIGYHEFTGAEYFPYVIKSGNNDGTWGDTPAGFPYRLSAILDGYWRVSIIPLTTGRMLAVYSSETYTVRARRWDGSAWGAETATTSLPFYCYCHSAVAEGDNVHLVFLKSSGYDILYVKYTYSTNNFGSEVTVQAGATSTSVPVLSRDPATGKLYCFYATKITGAPAGHTWNHIYYKTSVDGGGTWSAFTDWIDESTDVLLVADCLTCFYQAYGSRIGLVYMTKTASPYNVRFTFLQLNTAPTNDQLTLDLAGASYKGAKTLLAGKQDYKYVYKCTDADGVTTITYAEIRLDYASKNVVLRAARGTGDAWTFTEQSDPSNYVTLNTGASSHSTSGNQKTFNFLATVSWSWDDASETLGVRAYVIDSASAGDQDDYTNIFGVENDLSFANLNHQRQWGSTSVLRLPMDEGVGSTVYDVSGNSNQGTVYGGATWVDGKYGKALSFDGTDDYVDCGDDLSLDITAHLTLAVWFKLNTLNKYQYLISRDDAVNRNYALFVPDNNRIYFNIWSDGLAKGLYSTRTFGTGEWYHVVGTYDGAQLKVYANGVLNCTPLSFVGAIDNDDVSVTIGSREDGMDRWVDGVIDEVRIYNRALTAAEIQAKYLYGLNGYRVNPSTPLTLSGTLVYEGTTITPPNNNYDVAVKLGGVTQGTDTTLVGGAFAVNVTAPAAVGSHSYTAEATYMASAGNFSAVVVDRFELFSVAVDDDRINVGGSFELRYKIRYDYDDVVFTSAKGNIIGFAWDAGNSWWDKTITGSSSVTSTNYDEAYISITDLIYGLSAKQDVVGVNVVTDRLQVQSYTVADSRVNINDNVNIDVLVWFDYDDTVCATANITINGYSATHQGSGVYRITQTSTSVAGITYDTVACSAESTYGVTVVDQNGKSKQAIWDILEAVSHTVDLEGELIYVKIVYAYNGIAVQAGTVGYAGLNAQTNSTGWASFSTSNIVNVAYLSESIPLSDPTYGLTAGQALAVAYEKKLVTPFTIKAQYPITTPSWSDMEGRLAFVSSGTVKVDVANRGTPLKVEVDGATWTGWSYDPAKQRVTVSGLASNVALWWRETTPPGAVGGVVLPPAEPEPAIIIPPVVLPPDSTMMVNSGIAVIVVVIISAFVYKEVGPRQKKHTSDMWREKNKKEKPVKWEKTKKEKPVKSTKNDKFD